MFNDFETVMTVEVRKLGYPTSDTAESNDTVNHATGS